MEAEALHTLQEIRGILFYMAAVITVGVGYWMISSSSILFAAIRSAFSKDWKEQAIEYFDSGKLDELIAHCQERQKTHVNDAYLYYWQARVYHTRGDKKKASELFAKTLEISPEWTDSLKPYMD